MGRGWDCFEQLLDNPLEVFMDASGLLLKFASNIINNPDNPKYRSIRVGNKIFQSRLLPVNGAVECLFAIGFQEVLCSTSYVAKLKYCLYLPRPQNSLYFCLGQECAFNRPFPSSRGPLYKNEVRCSAFHMEMIFHSHANKTHFHKKGCALGLILKVRVFGTWKWPIQPLSASGKSWHYFFLFLLFL